MTMKPRARRLGLASAMLTLGLAATLTGGTASAADSEPLNYVNLGDSYSAGSGVLPLAKGSDLRCLQSERNFAHNIAAENGYALTDVSCAGAETKDFAQSQHPGVAPQLDALSAETDLVTMTIGGNDDSTFSGAALTCGKAGLLNLGMGNPCERQNGERFSDTIRNSIYPKLVDALESVKAKAPNAHIAVSGYPWVVPEAGGCFPKLPIAHGDIPYLRGIQATLNETVQRAANTTGVSYVDQSVASNGKDACKPAGERWIEPIIGATELSLLHPNARGERGMGEEFTKALALK